MSYLSQCIASYSYILLCVQRTTLNILNEQCNFDYSQNIGNQISNSTRVESNLWHKDVTRKPIMIKHSYFQQTTLFFEQKSLLPKMMHLVLKESSSWFVEIATAITNFYMMQQFCSMMVHNQMFKVVIHDILPLFMAWGLPLCDVPKYLNNSFVN